MSSPAVPTTVDAQAASIERARRLGLPASDPEVIAEGYSVRVRLRPAAVVTRCLTPSKSTPTAIQIWVSGLVPHGIDHSPAERHLASNLTLAS